MAFLVLATRWCDTLIDQNKYIMLFHWLPWALRSQLPVSVWLLCGRVFVAAPLPHSASAAVNPEPQRARTTADSPSCISNSPQRRVADVWPTIREVYHQACLQNKVAKVTNSSRTAGNTSVFSRSLLWAALKQSHILRMCHSLLCWVGKIYMMENYKKKTLKTLLTLQHAQKQRRSIFKHSSWHIFTLFITENKSFCHLIKSLKFMCLCSDAYRSTDWFKLCTYTWIHILYLWWFCKV